MDFQSQSFVFGMAAGLALGILVEEVFRVFPAEKVAEEKLRKKIRQGFQLIE